MIALSEEPSKLYWDVFHSCFPEFVILVMCWVTTLLLLALLNESRGVSIPADRDVEDILGDAAPKPKTVNMLGHSVPSHDEVLSHFGSASTEPLPSIFKVLVWNIYKGRKSAFDKEFQGLFQHLVLFQEMALTKDLMPIYERHPELQWEHAANFFLKDQARTGVATGSVTQASSVDFRVTKDLEPFAKLPKTIVITEYPVQGLSETLLVLNIHGINFRGTEGLQNQINQVLPVIRAHQGPVLFAGDFNTKNDERVTSLTKMLQTVGLSIVTWDNPIQGKQLDHAFVRGLKVNQAHILTHVKGSDHPALLLELSL